MFHFALSNVVASNVSKKLLPDGEAKSSGLVMVIAPSIANVFAELSQAKLPPDPSPLK